MKLFVLFLICFSVVMSNVHDDEDRDHLDEHADLHNANLRKKYTDFEQDPHENDPDYDEDVLTGTAHHHRRSREETKHDIVDLFKKIDTNADHKIEKQELVTYLIDSMKHLHNETSHEEFARIDKDHDGKIAKDEYFKFEYGESLESLENHTKTDNSSDSSSLKKKLNNELARFKAADNDGDGFLNVHEYLFFMYPIYFPHMAHTVVQDYIHDVDNNNDGSIDLKEYLSHFHITDKKNKEETEKELKKHEEDFKKYDKNGDGKIDQEEYYSVIKPGYEEPAQSEAEYLIAESDNNKDGLITLPEAERHSKLWLGSTLPESDIDDEDEDDDHHISDEL